MLWGEGCLRKGWVLGSLCLGRGLFLETYVKGGICFEGSMFREAERAVCNTSRGGFGELGGVRMWTL